MARALCILMSLWLCGCGGATDGDAASTLDTAVSDAAVNDAEVGGDAAATEDAPNADASNADATSAKDTGPTETQVCGCDSSFDLSKSEVVNCLNAKISACAPVSGGLWTSFGFTFIHVDGPLTDDGACPFRLYAEEDGFLRRYDCTLDAGVTFTNSMLTDAQWPKSPTGGACEAVAGCFNRDSACMPDEPSCTNPK